MKLKYKELIGTYWQYVQEEDNKRSGLLILKRQIRLNNLAEARASVAGQILSAGSEAVWTTLGEVFSGERGVNPEIPDWLADVILDFGAAGAGLAANVFKNVDFPTQMSFHILGFTFLERAKLMHALILSLVGEDESAGERIALACVSARGFSWDNLRRLLKRAEKVSQTRTAAQAALAKVAEYEQKKKFVGTWLNSHEYPQDVIQKETRIIGKVRKLK